MLAIFFEQELSSLKNLKELNLAENRIEKIGKLFLFSLKNLVYLFESHACVCVCVCVC